MIDGVENVIISLYDKGMSNSDIEEQLRDIYFTKTKIKQNKLINWLATSCFAVYLFHVNSYIFEYFQLIIRKIYYTQTY